MLVQRCLFRYYPECVTHYTEFQLLLNFFGTVFHVISCNCKVHRCTLFSRNGSDYNFFLVFLHAKNLWTDHKMRNSTITFCQQFVNNLSFQRTHVILHHVTHTQLVLFNIIKLFASVTKDTKETAKSALWVRNLSKHSRLLKYYDSISSVRRKFPRGPKFHHKSNLWGVPKTRKIEIQGEPRVLPKNQLCFC